SHDGVDDIDGRYCRRVYPLQQEGRVAGDGELMFGCSCLQRRQQGASELHVHRTAQSAVETHSTPSGRVTRSRFKRPSTLASESGESDCSQMSLISQQSAVSARTRKRTKTQARNDQSKDATTQKVNTINVDSTIVEKLVSDNADLRSQIVNLSASVEKLLNQYNSSSCQDMSSTFVEDLTRSIMIQVGNMVNARLEAIESRLLPEKRIRPPLAADLNKSGLSVTQTRVESSEVDSIKKGKKKKNHKNKRAVTVTAMNTTVTDLPPVLSHGIQSSSPAAVTETWATVQRIGMTGGMLLEISGADCNAKADKLATRMQEVLADIDVRITRPCKMGEIIILDVDESVSSVDVATAVAEAGGCSPDDVKVGVIRRQLNSLGRVWVRCPLATVKKLSSSNKIRIGWASMRVQFLEPRPLQSSSCRSRACPARVWSLSAGAKAGAWHSAASSDHTRYRGRFTSFSSVTRAP
ncbi:hypothetical protein HW555_000697, partial [Spodoptera exigua]